MAHLPPPATHPDDSPAIARITTVVSHHDVPLDAQASTRDANPKLSSPDDSPLYHRFSARRKSCITAILCLNSFLGPMSSTAVLAAIPDVAATFGTAGSVIAVSNALYLVACALAPCVWSPLSELYGKRWVFVFCSTLFFVCSLGSAMAPNLAAFFVFRLATGLEGAGFLLLGASTIGDMYKPTERGTAMGWFLAGTVIGPGFGPVIGGVIANFQSWRVYFWLQSCLSGIGTLLLIFFLPETAHQKGIDDIALKSEKHPLLRRLNPLQPLLLIIKYPNLLATGMASSALVWNMYSLLTPIRYTLNPRFGLDSPLEGGLFYLAPGCGYMAGTFIGGRWADITVQRWIRKRGGTRLPQDRLRSCIESLALVMPASLLVYGWSVDRAKGGYAVPIIAMFVQGIAQMFCFGSLNTYCVDVMQHRSSQVVGGNYIFRYSFGAAASAVALPTIEALGVGWASSISAGFMVASAGLVWLTIRYGERMQAWAERGIDGDEGSEK